MAEERQKEVQAVYEQAARECDEKVPGDANTPFMDLLKAHGGPPGTFSSHSRERLLLGDVERCLPSGDFIAHRLADEGAQHYSTGSRCSSPLRSGGSTRIP